MIGLIIYEAVWIFAMWWDGDKPKGVAFSLFMMAIPFLLIIRHYIKYDNSGLRDLDNEFLNEMSKSDSDYDSNMYHPDESSLSHNKSHSEWVEESLEKDKKRGQEYDRMWAEEYMDEHDY